MNDYLTIGETVARINVATTRLAQLTQSAPDLWDCDKIQKTCLTIAQSAQVLHVARNAAERAAEASVRIHEDDAADAIKCSLTQLGQYTQSDDPGAWNWALLELFARDVELMARAMKSLERGTTPNV